MSILISYLPQEIIEYVENQKKEITLLTDQFNQHTLIDPLCKESFILFLKHRIDQNLLEIGDYFDKHAKEHHFTPREIDGILHLIMSELLLIAKPVLENTPQEMNSAKTLLISWLKKAFISALKLKNNKTSNLGVMLHYYMTASRFEKEVVYQQIRAQLLQNKSR